VAGLGLDAGGTQTRWALAGDDRATAGEGRCAGFSGLQLETADGRAHVASALGEVARACGPVRAVVAGVTGFDATQLPAFRELAARAFGIEAAAVRAFSDIELACRAAFAPGEGVVVYAGTGSASAYIDGEGRLHRAGGRGVVIDDAGGGHWIATRAMRHILRAEDVEPGAWQRSAMACRVFDHIGGSDWPAIRRWAYGASRGEIGRLALAVAAAADTDPAALALLQAAGRELARLGAALGQRFGTRPLALAGRVFELHPAIELSLRAALPSGSDVRRSDTPAHHAAARLAATRTSP
jgi:N-acetylglucosamine kinase-like BadF-type ATPase